MKLPSIALLLLLGIGTLGQAQAPTVEESINRLQNNITLLIHRSQLQDEVMNEMGDMAVDLSKLHDEQVNAIMRPHIAKVQVLLGKIAQNAKGAK